MEVDKCFDSDLTDPKTTLSLRDNVIIQLEKLAIYVACFPWLLNVHVCHQVVNVVIAI